MQTEEKRKYVNQYREKNKEKINERKRAWQGKDMGHIGRGIIKMRVGLCQLSSQAPCHLTQDGHDFLKKTA